MIDPRLNLLAKTLKKSGYSLTKPRQLVFKLLANQSPQAMADLQIQSRSQINRASLYRIIKLYEEIGVVQRVHIGWKHKLELSEHFSSHHHHVYCLRCGVIIDVKEPAQLEKYIDVIAKKTGFRIDSHVFELEGVCRDCQNQ